MWLDHCYEGSLILPGSCVMYLVLRRAAFHQARDLALATPWFADGADGTPAPESAPVSPAVLAVCVRPLCRHVAAVFCVTRRAVCVCPHRSGCSAISP